MTVHDTRPAIDTPAIPRPRAPQQDPVDPPARTPEPPVVMTVPPALGQYPWPEPWHFSRAARPRSEFWDVATASWHSRGPYPRTDRD